MKRLALTLLVCTASFSAFAIAQTPQPQTDLKALADVQARMNAAPDTSLPPVASLTCEQMLVELGAAGARMNSQLDPSFAANAQALHDRATAPPTAPPSQAQVAENHARVNQVSTQLAGSMQGIDLQRMMALTTQFSAKNCKTPQ